MQVTVVAMNYITKLLKRIVDSFSSNYEYKSLFQYMCRLLLRNAILIKENLIKLKIKLYFL